MELHLQELIAQALGIAGTVMLLTLYHCKTRRKMLWHKWTADLLWSAHYLCLGAVGGAIPNAVGVLRESVFLYDKPWTRRKLLPVVFIVINWCVAFASGVNSYSFLPIAASTLVTVSLFVEKPTLTRLLSIPVCTAFLVYDGLVGSWAGMVNEALSLVSIVTALIKNDLPKKNKTSE